MINWWRQTVGVANKSEQCGEISTVPQNNEADAESVVHPNGDLAPEPPGAKATNGDTGKIETKPASETRPDLASSLKEEEGTAAQGSNLETDPFSNPKNTLAPPLAEKGIISIHNGEVETSPSLYPHVDTVPSEPGYAQGPGLIAETGLSQTDVASDGGTLSQEYRYPTPDQLPRQSTVDSGCDVTHTNDQDIERKLVSSSMQAVAAPKRTIDKAVSAKSESADGRARKRARERFIQEFHNLSEKRSDVLALRFKVQEVRASLKREREASLILDAELLQKTRVAVVNIDATELGSFLPLLEGLEKSRDNLKPKEDEYEALESTLNHQEWELKEMEQRLFPQGSSVQMSLFGDEDIVRFERELEETKSSLGSSAAHAEESPLMMRYLSRKGDAEILREQLFEMEEERAELLERKETRAGVGLELDEESRAILDDFDVRHDALQRELEYVEEDISILREALTNKDDLFFSINLFEPNGREAINTGAAASYSPNISYQDDEDGPLIGPEPVPHDPLLASSDDPLHMLRSSDASNWGGISTPRYINRWMLNKLRRSRPEVRLFRSTEKFQELSTKLSQEEIRDSLLEWWFKDQSVRDYEESRAAANTVLDLSAATEEERALGLSEAGTQGEPTLLEPILQSRESELLEASTSIHGPPIQAAETLSPGD